MNFLDIEKTDVEFNICSGCGRRFREGEERLVGINSYYDSESRINLCKECIEWAYEKLFKE